MTDTNETVGITCDLPDNNRIDICLRFKVSPNDFAQIQRVFELAKLAFIKDEAVDENS